MSNSPHRYPFINPRLEVPSRRGFSSLKGHIPTTTKGLIASDLAITHERALALIYKIEHRRNVIGTLKRYIGGQTRPESTLRALVLAHIFWID